MRYLEATPEIAAQQSARMWTLYEAEQRAARGLRPQDSLDVETTYHTGRPVSRILPLAQAVTTGANGYVLPVVSADSAIAALPLDDFALAQQGRGGVDVRNHKDVSALDDRLRERLEPTTRAGISPTR